MARSVSFNVAVLFLFLENVLLCQSQKSYFSENIRAYPDRDNKIDDIFLRFYNGNKFGEYVDVRLEHGVKLLDENGFNKARPTMLYIHGFKETALQESVQVVISAYLESRPDTNIILLDWSNMALGSYFINAAPNTKKVSLATALQIKALIDKGVSADSIHIVGHSLGGQVAGFIGKHLKNMNITIRRITALDPAFPEFYPALVMGHVSAGDARFVDVVHTDAGGYGAPVTTGAADFWPNGGKSKQPGCPRFTPVPLSDDDLCSHWRSWRFYAESLRSPRAFAAAPATSFSKFKRDTGLDKPNKGVVYMGIDCDENARGNYYLITNDCPPFGKGQEGLYYKRK